MNTKNISSTSSFSTYDHLFKINSKEEQLLNVKANKDLEKNTQFQETNNIELLESSEIDIKVVNPEESDHAKYINNTFGNKIIEVNNVDQLQDVVSYLFGKIPDTVNKHKLDADKIGINST